MNEKQNAAGYDNEAKRRSRDTVKCRSFTLVGGPIHTHVHTDTHAMNLMGFQVESLTLTDNTDVGLG